MTKVQVSWVCLSGFYWFVFAAVGFELRASHLLGKHSTTWPTPLALSCWLFLREGLPFYAGVCLDHYPPVCASSGSWNNRYLSHTHPLILPF
jgi:hypothetical protein